MSGLSATTQQGQNGQHTVGYGLVTDWSELRSQGQIQRQIQICTGQLVSQVQIQLLKHKYKYKYKVKGEKCVLSKNLFYTLLSYLLPNVCSQLRRKNRRKKYVQKFLAKIC